VFDSFPPARVGIQMGGALLRLLSDLADLKKIQVVATVAARTGGTRLVMDSIPTAMSHAAHEIWKVGLVMSDEKLAYVDFECAKYRGGNMPPRMKGIWGDGRGRIEP
jgi:hypothetical protein